MSAIRHHGLPASANNRKQSPGFLKRMTQWPVCRSALKVSLVVGTILDIRNNGEQLWSNQPVPWWHVGTNTLVPFRVARYRAARNDARWQCEG